MDNNNINVAYIIQAPHTFDLSYTNLTNSGIHGDVVKLFCEKFHCHYKLMPNNDFGTLENGTWTGMTRCIYDGDCDLGVPFLIATADRSSVLSFSQPLFYMNLFLVTRHAGFYNTLPEFFSSLVFNYSVWLCLIVLSSFIGLLVTIAHCNLMDKRSLTWFHCASSSIDAFSFITAQTGDLTKITHLSIRFLLSFWGMALVIMCGVYSGQVMSSVILINKAKLPFHDFATFVDCIEVKQCVFLMNEQVESFRSTSRLPVYERFWAYLKYNEKFFVNTTQEMMSKIVSEKNRYLVTMMLENVFLEETNYNEKCLYDTVQLETYPVALGYRKNFKYKKPLDEFVIKYLESGFGQHGAQKYLKKEINCARGDISRELKPVSVPNFVGSVYIVLIGVVISFIAFIIEIARNFYKRYS